MGKKIYLTKKRMKGMHTALSMDDLLYERFRRLSDDLMKKGNEISPRENRFAVTLKNDDEICSLRIIDVFDRGDIVEIVVSK